MAIRSSAVARRSTGHLVQVVAPDVDVDVRRADGDDRERVLALLAKFYRGDCAARYERLYCANPHGAALTWLALDRSSGDAVGCTSLFPRRVRVAGRERTGAIGGDCFVEPHVRRRGLALALHRASFAGMQEDGVQFMYGPPAARNLGALVKAGSRLVGDYRRYVRPLDGHAAFHAAFCREPGRLTARISHLALRILDGLRDISVRGLSLDAVDGFGPEFDELFDGLAPMRAIACVRDRAFLAWRYPRGGRQVPLAMRHGGRLVGLVVMEIHGLRAALVDIFTASDRTDAAIQLAASHAVSKGCSVVEVAVTGGGALARRLGRRGYVIRGTRGFQVAVSPHDEQVDVLLTPASWELMEADKDLDTVLSTDGAGASE